MKGKQEEFLDAIKIILRCIGEDPEREGLKKTPLRIYKSFKYLFSGYNEDPTSHLSVTFKEDQLDPQIVVMKDIKFYSMCEHHMLPFYGHAHIAYLPYEGQGVIGASKIIRLLHTFSRRLQIQERLCDQVTTALMAINVKGAACIIEASHMCISARGVENQDAIMVTSSLKGIFREDAKSRSEVLELLWKKK